MTRVAINGLGRIGRAFLKRALARPELDVVAVNDLGEPENLAYLLRFDSVYGRLGEAVAFDAGTGGAGDAVLSVGAHRIRFLQQRDPDRLPWRALGVDVVVEATGAYETYDEARVHPRAAPPIIVRLPHTAAVMRTSCVARTGVIAAALVAAASACVSSAAPSRGSGGPDLVVSGARPRRPSSVQRHDTDVPVARADMRDLDGRPVGTVRFTQAPHGVVVTAELSGLRAGVHAMHVHAVGRCEPPFSTAGGHYNPALRQHGVKNRAGFHAGDLPNVNAAASGTVRVDAISRDVTLGRGPVSLFTPQGTALVVHRDADDYTTDPSGGAGVRIACGVIVPDSAARLAPAASPQR